MPEKEPELLTQAKEDFKPERIDFQKSGINSIAVMGLVAFSLANSGGNAESRVPSESNQLGALPIMEAKSAELPKAGSGLSPYMCSKVVGIIPPDYVPKPVFKYDGASTTRWTAKYIFESIEACKGKGVRSVSFFQEMSTDSGHTWTRSSGFSAPIKSNKPICDKIDTGGLKCSRPKTGSINAPFDCTKKQSTSLRGTFRVHWDAKKGKDNTKYYSYPSKKPIC